MIVITVAAAVAYRSFGHVAETNLVRIAEENTVRDALHIQSMMRIGNSMHSMVSDRSVDSREGTQDMNGPMPQVMSGGARIGDDMKEIPESTAQARSSRQAAGTGSEMSDLQRPTPLTLEYLVGPEGLPSIHPMLVEGLNIVEFTLIDPNSTVVWSTDSGAIGTNTRKSPGFSSALAGRTSSSLHRAHEIIDINGVSRRMDVVETTMPLRETPSGAVIGLMELDRGVAHDVALQVDDARNGVLRTTIGTMGGLFLVLSGFILAANVAINRSRQREVSLVEARLAERKQTEEKLAAQARELARSNQELARSNQELEQFAYVASHDLQEPLRMVTSFTQRLGERYKGKLDADADTYISFAVDGAIRMRALINDLLAYSRVGTGGKEFEPTDCEMVIDGALANLQAAVEESGARVTRDPLPTVSADASQLGRVFQNLTSNAIKYRNESPPEVHIGAEKRDGEWLFSVRDNGIGIDPEQAERVFVIFQRLHSRDEYPGTGIGLAITRKIVERHGGRIWVESELGMGSTFYLTIPARKVIFDKH